MRELMLHGQEQGMTSPSELMHQHASFGLITQFGILVWQLRM